MLPRVVFVTVSSASCSPIPQCPPFLQSSLLQLSTSENIQSHGNTWCLYIIITIHTYNIFLTYTSRKWYYNRDTNTTTIRISQIYQTPWQQNTKDWSNKFICLNIMTQLRSVKRKHVLPRNCEWNHMFWSNIILSLWNAKYHTVSNSYQHTNILFGALICLNWFIFNRENIAK